MALTGAQQPALMASALAQMGATALPSGNLGAATASGVPGLSLDMSGGLGALLGGGGGISPAPTVGGGAPGAASGGLSALQGIKAPEQPKPEFRAGVSGAQQAPQLGAVKASSPMTDMLMHLIGGGNQGNRNPLRVPNLGALLGG